MRGKEKSKGRLHTLKRKTTLRATAYKTLAIVSKMQQIYTAKLHHTIIRHQRRQKWKNWFKKSIDFFSSPQLTNVRILAALGWPDFLLHSHRKSTWWPLWLEFPRRSFIKQVRCINEIELVSRICTIAGLGITASEPTHLPTVPETSKKELRKLY